ncbi:hypothetical protein PISMIDRAFT_481192 [Pisolithus microcarpus 441]|uniref:Uncharacterized protein n=1 Tax=Pisolithus microcarpus 441 TaxID=765257 RepID=A0A0D0ABN9_9AGAM|nr:hypothetical protein PISMIDRAFT_481192 [Pisolithus microcarpus 441]
MNSRSRGSAVFPAHCLVSNTLSMVSFARLCRRCESLMASCPRSGKFFFHLDLASRD